MCARSRLFWVTVAVLILVGCDWLMAWSDQATGPATQEQVKEQLEPLQVVPVSDVRERVWAYRYTGMTSPILLPVTEGWRVEHRLVFDEEKILRYWKREASGQPLDLKLA